MIIEPSSCLDAIKCGCELNIPETCHINTDFNLKVTTVSTVNSGAHKFSKQKKIGLSMSLI